MTFRGVERAVRRAGEALRRRARPKTARGYLKKVGRIRTVSRNGHQYSFVCPNRVVTWRVRSFFTKEPETLEWIDGFADSDVLFDVGANIGLYSIYAAARSIRVVAFEPESQNYALVNQNIFLNGFGDRVACLPVALSDRTAIDFIYLSRFRAGESLHNFGAAEDWQHAAFDPSFQQGSVSFSLDAFLELRPDPFPTHIKIDVDGLEGKIVSGAARTLRDPRVRSLLVEFNGALAEDVAAIKAIEQAGFALAGRKRGPSFNAEKFPEVYNYIFVRR